MDYEKKYKEALERARKIHSEIVNNEIIGFPGQIEDIFPELRESEDERVRKEMISFLRSPFIKENLTNEKVAPWLSYLEKQKEQKHPNGCFTCDEYKKGYEEGRRNGFTAGYNKAIKEVEQNVEQKPAEWSEEDEKMRNLAIEWAETMYGQFRFVDIGSTDFRKIVAWLKSIRPQPKQEWSEEEKQILHSFEVICQRLIENPHGEKFEVERSYAKKMLA